MHASLQQKAGRQKQAPYAGRLMTAVDACIRRIDRRMLHKSLGGRDNERCQGLKEEANAILNEQLVRRWLKKQNETCRFNNRHVVVAADHADPVSPASARNHRCTVSLKPRVHVQNKLL